MIGRAQDLVLLQEREGDFEEAYKSLSNENLGGLRSAELVARQFLAWKIPRTKFRSGTSPSPPLRDMIQSLMTESDTEDFDMENQRM